MRPTVFIIPHAQLERGKVIGVGVYMYIYIYVYMFADQIIFISDQLNFKKYAVGLLVKFIDCSAVSRGEGNGGGLMVLQHPTVP